MGESLTSPATNQESRAYTRLLTAPERERVKAYIKADGERSSDIRQLVTRCNKHLPQIKKDLELLEKLVATYDSHVKKGGD